MKHLLTLLIIMLIISCKPELDKTDINSIAEYTIDYLENKKLNSILSLMEPIDSTNLLKKAQIRSRLSPIEALFDINELNIINHKVIREHFQDAGITYAFDEVIIFIEANGDIYKFRGITDKKEGKLYYSYVNLSNLTLDCDDYNTKPYQPQNIQMDKAYWLLSNDRKSFKEFHIKGKNRSDNQVEELQFRLKLKKTSGEEFFSKTIIRNMTIMPEDTFEIDVNELNDFFVGYILSNKTFKFNIEILSVLPKPPNTDCELLEELIQ